MSKMFDFMNNFGEHFLDLSLFLQTQSNDSITRNVLKTSVLVKDNKMINSERSERVYDYYELLLLQLLTTYSYYNNSDDLYDDEKNMPDKKFHELTSIFFNDNFSLTNTSLLFTLKKFEEIKQENVDYKLFLSLYKYSLINPKHDVRSLIPKMIKIFLSNDITEYSSYAVHNMILSIQKILFFDYLIKIFSVYYKPGHSFKQTYNTLLLDIKNKTSDDLSNIYDKFIYKDNDTMCLLLNSMNQPIVRKMLNNIYKCDETLSNKIDIDQEKLILFLNFVYFVLAEPELFSKKIDSNNKLFYSIIDYGKKIWSEHHDYISRTHRPVVYNDDEMLEPYDEIMSFNKNYVFNCLYYH